MPEHIHDKGYKRLFSQRENFLDFLKKYVRLYGAEKINPDNLIAIKNNYTDGVFKENQSDIIYCLKSGDQEIIFYVILEFQAKNDYTMPFRFLTYMFAMMREKFQDAKEEHNRKDFRLPAIVPILLYHGSVEWKVITQFRDYLSGAKRFGDYTINFEYPVIDLRRTDTEFIFSTNTVLDNVFALDKSENAEELKTTLEEIIHRIQELSDDDKLQFTGWIRDVFSKVGSQEQVEVLTTALYEGDVCNMETALEKMLDDERNKYLYEGIEEGKREGIEVGKREGIEVGIKEGEIRAKREMARRMLHSNLQMEMIMEVTGLSASEIEELKNE